MSVVGADVEPPPGFENEVPEQQPAPPDVPPEPSFRRPEVRTSSGSQYGGSEEWSARERDDRKGETTHGEWTDSNWSHGDKWRHSGWGDIWDGGKGDDIQPGWGRRSSWESTTMGASRTGTDSYRARRNDEDPWDGGRDPWLSGRSDRLRREDPCDQRERPWADGRDGRAGDNDYDHRRQWWDNGNDDNLRRGQWTDDRTSHSSLAAEDGVAWNGWSHFGNGGFKGATQEGSYGGRPSQGRPSERLSVPSFQADDTEDLGGSARSYLRQIEAWRRMTYLPPEQQALVLYQNLGGKAWVAAEELSVAKLASPGGIQYYVSWISARFLDLEVARVGKAFSDFFRRLRRKNGQSIREYNTEYDRLHARLREVGCQLPEDCAAWLYIDRLQLEEAQELNLLASVGNQYNLHKLQQAAVLHDRGHRKPWEREHGKGRRPHTAHVTSYDDGGISETEDEADFHDGVPEEVAQAYLTYQTAKNRYKDQAKNRGYQGGAKDDGGDREARKDLGNPGREERLKKLKSKSFCASCGQKGHWHKDSECPNNKANGGTEGKPVRGVEVCHHVLAEVMTLKHEGEALVGITDTACAKSVAGTGWMQRYSDLAAEIGEKVDLVKECEAFRFGTGKIHYSAFHVVIKFLLGSKLVSLKVSVINGDVPLLLSKKALAQLGMIYDIAKNVADFSAVELRNFPLLQTTSGHPAIPISPAKAGEGDGQLQLLDNGPMPAQQYTAFVVSDHVPTAPKPYKIFYDKKLSLEVKQMLTQDRLSETSFIAWWNSTNIDSDFWVEGEFAWHRIHVTPRRSLFSPYLWKTHGTVQKDMLLSCIGKYRVTEGFCSRTGKPLESAVDVVERGDDQPSFPLFWFGRSTFAKATAPLASLLPPSATGGHEQLVMPTTSDQPHEQGGVVGRSQPCGGACASPLDGRGNQGCHPGASHGEQPGLGDEVHLEPDAGRAEDEGQKPGSRLWRADHQGEPDQAHPGPHEHAGPRADEDREVPGLRVRGHTRGLRRVGVEGGEGEFESTPGACTIREVVRHQEGEGHLRRPGVCRGELHGALPEGALRGCELTDVEGHRLERCGGGGRLGKPEPHSTSDEDDPNQEANRERGPQHASRHQDRGGGDRGAREASGGSEEEGCGQGLFKAQRALSYDARTGSGGPRPPPEQHGHEEDSVVSIFPDVPHPGHHSGASDQYNHIGSHFGGKTIVNLGWCCGSRKNYTENEEFITDGDFVSGGSNQSSVYAVDASDGDLDHRPHLRRALREGDYSFDTVHSILEVANMKGPRRTQKERRWEKQLDKSSTRPSASTLMEACLELLREPKPMRTSRDT